MYRWDLPHFKDPITALRITRHWGCSITAPWVTYVRWRTSRPCISRIQVPCVMFWSLITATFTVSLIVWLPWSQDRIACTLSPSCILGLWYVAPRRGRATGIVVIPPRLLRFEALLAGAWVAPIRLLRSGQCILHGPVRLVPRVIVVPLRCTTWASGYLGSCISTPWIILILLFTITGPWIIFSDWILLPRFIRYAFLLWSPCPGFDLEWKTEALGKSERFLSLTEAGFWKQVWRYRQRHSFIYS